jgi:hypothetical protein
MNDTSNTQTPDACATDESLIQSNWKWLAFRGALALLFGVIALFSPLSAVYALTFVFGAYALIDGVASVVMGVRHAREKAEQWWSMILRGVLGIFAGIAVVLVPWAAAMALVVFNWVMLAMWAIAAGERPPRRRRAGPSGDEPCRRHAEHGLDDGRLRLRRRHSAPHPCIQTAPRGAMNPWRPAPAPWSVARLATQCYCVALAGFYPASSLSWLVLNYSLKSILSDFLIRNHLSRIHP